MNQEFPTPAPTTRSHVGRCAVCKAAAHIDVVSRPILSRLGVKVATVRTHNGNPIKVAARGTAEKITEKTGIIFLSCCGELHKLKPIKGCDFTDHQCGARCTNAIGPACSCDCGGINHGRAHAL